MFNQAKTAPKPDHLMVICAPNGARRTKADHPALPMTPEQLADEAMKLKVAGVSVMHIHVRDEDGGHSLDADTYRSAIDAIRTRVTDGLIIQITTEACGIYSRDDQIEVVEAVRPEAVSLALREFCPSQAREARGLAFFRWVDEAGIWPQYIVYTPEELVYLEQLRQRGVLGSTRPSCLLVLGSYAEQRQGTVRELQNFLAVLGGNHFDWAACCFGQSEQMIMRQVVRAGGHVRIGFENNLHLPNGQKARHNAHLINEFLESLPSGSPTPAPASRIRETRGLAVNR